MFALGRYAGARRQAIVAMKDRGRIDLTAPLAYALALGVHRLLEWGLLDVPLTIVPAPTRSWAARRRGGDPVTRIATLATAGHPHVTVVRALRMKALARDSAGLGSAARERNIAGRVLLTRRRCPPAARCCSSTTSSRPARPPVSRCACCNRGSAGGALCWR